MEIKAVAIIVERDPMTKIPKVVPAWELDVWQEKYPGKIEVSGHTTIAVDELPDADAEADRLRTHFGADEKTNLVFFDEVYGRGRAGAAEFEKALHAARVRPAKHAKPKNSDAATADDDAGTKDAAGAGASTDPLDDPA